MGKEMTEVELQIARDIKQNAEKNKVFSAEELSWRYAVWDNDRVVGVKDITGKLVERILGIRKCR